MEKALEDVSPKLGNDSIGGAPVSHFFGRLGGPKKWSSWSREVKKSYEEFLSFLQINYYKAYLIDL